MFLAAFSSRSDVATTRAHMRSDTEGFLHVLTTRGTFLRSVVRCHGNDLTTSTFSLGFKILSECSPGCIGKRPNNGYLPCSQPSNLQCDGLIAFDILVRGFMEGILPLVGDAPMDTGNLFPRFLAAVAPFLHLASFVELWQASWHSSWHV